jgi:lysophospholipase L1-like esterase
MLFRSIYSLRILPGLALCLQAAPLPASGGIARAEVTAPPVSAPPVSAPPKRPPYRVIRQGMFDLSKIDSASVVMLGDSLTEGAQWAEITGCRYLANRGISADDSAGVVRRLDDVIKLKPSAVFLMIGVNDVASGVPTTTIVDNVQQTLRTLTRAGARVYLTLVLPVGQSYRRQINPKIDELNAAYREIAQEEEKVEVVDFRAGMRTEPGYLRDEFSVDALHLMPEGYRVWRDAITPFIEKYCSSSDNRASAAKPRLADGRQPVRR